MPVRDEGTLNIRRAANPLKRERDERGSLVIKVTDSWLACHQFEPSTSEDSPYRGDRCTLNLWKLKCPPVGMAWNNRMTLSFGRVNVHQLPLHSVSSGALKLEFMKRLPRLGVRNHLATVATLKQLSCHLRHLTMAQNYEFRLQ
ncbi:hypothetical protein TNCV_4252951 [Trichonephila clavipes]|nr:hypothetical protein TNCV_4252951 [Trichonephila clavipes]